MQEISHALANSVSHPPSQTVRSRLRNLQTFDDPLRDSEDLCDRALPPKTRQNFHYKLCRGEVNIKLGRRDHRAVWHYGAELGSGDVWVSRKNEGTRFATYNGFIAQRSYLQRQ